ncbi:hypothetical protein M5236_004659 [Vibrio parahaemolyticus]|nr:hypothetical protein [Vibrio parahaemolyticus]
MKKYLLAIMIFMTAHSACANVVQGSRSYQGERRYNGWVGLAIINQPPNSKTPSLSLPASIVYVTAKK